MSRRAKLKAYEAETEAAEVRSWKCESCTKLLDEHEHKYCWQCADYWKSVDEGLFDREEDWA